jgi:polygalacturonase
LCDLSDATAHISIDDYPPVLNVLDFGAKGDGIADDTYTLRMTLDEAASLGGAIVLLPENYSFVSGPLNLTSNIILQVDGALRALTWSTTYWPQIPPLEVYGCSEDGPVLQYQPFLYATNCQNIKIIGKGTIDGNGQPWWDVFKSNRRIFTGGRPNLVQMVHCHDIEITGVTLKDSPFWCLHPVLSTNIHIHHMKIRSPMYSPNSDGIDPDSCRNVMIEHNDISCGDDHIAIKSGRCGGGAPIECNGADAFTNGTYETVNVTVRKNIFRIGMGIALGNYFSVFQGAEFYHIRNNA